MQTRGMWATRRSALRTRERTSTDSTPTVNGRSGPSISSVSAPPRSWAPEVAARATRSTTRLGKCTARGEPANSPRGDHRDTCQDSTMLQSVGCWAMHSDVAGSLAGCCSYTSPDTKRCVWFPTCFPMAVILYVYLPLAPTTIPPKPPRASDALTWRE